MRGMRGLSIHLWRNSVNGNVVAGGGVVARAKFNKIANQKTFATKSGAVSSGNVRESSSAAATAATATSPEMACPHITTQGRSNGTAVHETNKWQNALPYNEIPGPKPIPILGNTWR